MEAVSLGEEKPKATGSNEAAWAENRRADIVYNNQTLSTLLPGHRH
jgi:outer membrane protein OmpA-like peptidoglycan-associated protein